MVQEQVATVNWFGKELQADYQLLKTYAYVVLLCIMLIKTIGWKPGYNQPHQGLTCHSSLVRMAQTECVASDTISVC